MEKQSDSWRDGFINRLNVLVNRTSGGNASDFARKAGINDRTYKKYLKGSMPGADKLFQIANAGNVSADWLLTGEEFSEPEPCNDRTREAVEKVKEIMASGHAIVIPALEANLVAFVGAVETDKDNKNLRKDVNKLKKEVKGLKARVQMVPIAVAPDALNIKRGAANGNDNA